MTALDVHHRGEWVACGHALLEYARWMGEVGYVASAFVINEGVSDLFETVAIVRIEIGGQSAASSYPM